MANSILDIFYAPFGYQIMISRWLPIYSTRARAHAFEWPKQTFSWSLPLFVHSMCFSTMNRILHLPSIRLCVCSQNFTRICSSPNCVIRMNYYAHWMYHKHFRQTRHRFWMKCLRWSKVMQCGAKSKHPLAHPIWLCDECDLEIGAQRRPVTFFRLIL